MPKEGDLVAVYWGDHASISGYHDSVPETLLDCIERTVGWFWRCVSVDMEIRPSVWVTKEVVCLHSSSHKDDPKKDRCDPHIIFKDAIFEIRLLEEVKEDAL